MVYQTMFCSNNSLDKGNFYVRVEKGLENVFG